MHSLLPSRILLNAVATLVLAASALRAADAPAAPAATTPAPAAGNYTVNFNPAIKVGQKFSVVSDVSSNNVMNAVISGAQMPVPQTQNRIQTLTGHLEADGEVQVLFANGSTKKIALTVTALNATLDGTIVTGLPAAGAKVIVEKDDANKETITVNGRPALETVARVLTAAISLGAPKYTDQDVFGPKGPVAIGSTWSMNTTAFTEQSTDFPGADSVAGTVKLDGVTGTGDDRVAVVSGNVTVKGLKISMPMVTVKNAEMTAQLTGSLPATTTKGVRNETMSSKLNADAEGSAPDGRQIKMTITTEQKNTSKTTYR